MPHAPINGTRIYYEAHGKGIPLIFIHPPLMSGVNFERQVKALSPYFQVITFDIRGHGESLPSAAPVTYWVIAEDIAGLMDHLGIEKAFIAGYSTGGGIVMEFLLSYPKRALGGISISGMSEVSHWKLRAEIHMAAKMMGRLPRAVCSLVALGNADHPIQFKRFYRAATKANVNNAAEYFRSSNRYHCTHDLWKITVPVLLIAGEKDKRFVHYAHMMNKRLPYGEVSVIGNGRHQLPTKAAIEVNDLIRSFISRHREPVEEDRVYSLEEITGFANQSPESARI